MSSTQAVLKWPSIEDFPSFVGVSFTQCDDSKEGHGLLVRRLSYWNYEPAPNWRGSSFLFRMYYKAEDLERPDDAAPELRAGLNKHFTQIRYFEGCTRKKVFVLVGAEDLDEETTAPRGSYFRYGDPRWNHNLVTIDELNENLPIGSRPWAFYSLKHRGMQFSLSSDNRILSNIDYWRVRNIDAAGETHDPLQSAAYFIAQPQVTLPDERLAPTEDTDIRFYDPQKPICSEISSSYDPESFLQQWQKCFGQGDGKFWNALESPTRPVYYNCEIRNVDNIDQEHGVYAGMLQVEIQWPLTKLEVIEYLSASTAGIEDWSPPWHPPEFEVVNQSTLQPTRFERQRIMLYHPKGDKKYRCLVNRCQLRLGPDESTSSKQPLNHESAVRLHEEVMVLTEVTGRNGMQYIRLADGSGFYPLFLPDGMPAFKLVNEKHVRVDVRQREHSAIWATQTWQVRGEFYVTYDLKAYPYDGQRLKMKLQTTVPSKKLMHMERMNRYDPVQGVIKNPEWRVKDEELGTVFTHRFYNQNQHDWMLGLERTIAEDAALRPPSTGVGIMRQSSGIKAVNTTEIMSDAEDGHFQILVWLDIERRSSVYTQRVIIPTALFSLLSLGTFSLSQSDDTADRLGIPVSLLLTATAYSLTVATEIPRVGYITMLESYVLYNSFFIGLVCAGVVFLNYLESDIYAETEDSDSGMARDFWALLLSAVLWIGMQIWFFTYIRKHGYKGFPTKKGKRQQTSISDAFERGFYSTELSL